MKVLKKFYLQDKDAEKYVDADERIDQETISQEVRDFWHKLLAIIKKIISKRLTDKKKKIVMCFINNLSLEETAVILSKSYNNLHKRYWNIIANIRADLCWSDDFMNLVENDCPGILRSRMKEWIEEERNKTPKVRCPVCNELFKNHVTFKNHLILIKYRKSVYDKMDKKHIKFLNDQEKRIDKCLKKHKRFKEAWVQELMQSKDFYLGYHWIYKYCSKNKKKYH